MCTLEGDWKGAGWETILESRPGWSAAGVTGITITPSRDY